MPFVDAFTQSGSDKDDAIMWGFRLLMALTVANGLFLLSELALNVVGSIVR